MDPLPPRDAARASEPAAEFEIAAHPRPCPSMSESGDAVARIAALQQELAEQARRAADAQSAARDTIIELSTRLRAIEESTAWRATAPFRKVGAKLPSPARHLLRTAIRWAYWAATPHMTAIRRQFIAHSPVHEAIVKRLAAESAAARDRLGALLRRSYGPTLFEQLDIFPTARPNAPIFVFIHGGGWLEAEAKNSHFPAPMFVDAGAHFVVLDFIGARSANGDLRVVADQVRRGISWVYQNAESFGGDRDRLYVGGHSSGSHLCALALVTDWQREFGLPCNPIKAALLMSGFYDLRSTRNSKLYPYVLFTDEIEHAVSPRRHVEGLSMPLVITCGSRESREFRQQAHDFYAAVKAAGVSASLIEAADHDHMQMAESLGHPDGVNGREALALMGLSQAAR